MVDEKRLSSRKESDETVRVKVITDKPLEHKDFQCRISDLSDSGLRLFGEVPLQQGMTLGLLVEVKGQPRRYTLNGKVQWITSTTENEYIAGIELIESPVSDYNVWKELFSETVS